MVRLVLPALCLVAVLAVLVAPRKAEPQSMTSVYLPLVRVPCAPPAQHLLNHSFEDGLTGWIVSGMPVRIAALASDGQASVELGGNDSADSVLVQRIAVPVWAEMAMLHFDWRVTASQPADRRPDVLIVGLSAGDGSRLASRAFTSADAGTDWAPGQVLLVDATPFRGQELSVFMQAHTDWQRPTTWYVDNAHISFACGGIVP